MVKSLIQKKKHRQLMLLIIYIVVLLNNIIMNYMTSKTWIPKTDVEIEAEINKAKSNKIKILF